MDNKIKNIAVCLKPVHDINNPVGFNSRRELDGDSICRYVINPQDTFALEEALQLKSQVPESRLIVISVAPDKTDKQLKYALAAGADEALRVWDPALENADPFIIANVLASALRHVHADLAFSGCQSSNLGRGLTPSMVAEILKFVFVSAARNVGFSPDENRLFLDQKVDKQTLKLKLSPPALLAVRQSHPLRYPTAIAKIRANKTAVPCMSPADLNIDIDALEPLCKLLRIVAPKPLKKASVPTATTGHGKLTAIMGQGAPKQRNDSNVFEGDPKKTAAEAIAALIENRAIGFGE
jgi:electron transfer flavoprotein beta subunit